eukprot:294713-Prymnesium_polylepis.1
MARQTVEYMRKRKQQRSNLKQKRDACRASSAQYKGDSGGGKAKASGSGSAGACLCQAGCLRGCPCKAAKQ